MEESDNISEKITINNVQLEKNYQTKPDSAF